MEEKQKVQVAVGYARIVRFGDLRDLDRQAQRIYDYCQEHSIELRVVLSEGGERNMSWKILVSAKGSQLSLDKHGGMTMG